MAIEILTAFWLDLKPHAERNAVFFVHQELDLSEVAETVAQDDATTVNEWVQAGHLARPTAAQTEAWNHESARAFRVVIVQPYVLIQDIGH